MTAIESVVNIGPVLAGRLRTAGIASLEDLQAVGDTQAFQRLAARFPDDACLSTRFAIAGAFRGVRWHQLPVEQKTAIKKEFEP